MSANGSTSSELAKSVPLTQRFEGISAIAEGLTHDLMGVLASVSMSLEVLVPKLAAEDAWLAQGLTEVLTRGQEGVRQIYWLASAQPGRPLAYDPLHLLKEAQRRIALAHPWIKVSTEYPPEVGLVHGEPGLLLQLLLGAATEACLRAGREGELVLRGEGGGIPGVGGLDRACSCRSARRSDGVGVARSGGGGER